MPRPRFIGGPGTTVVVTGGSSGIGLACARAYARLGSNVVIMARTVSRIESARVELESLSRDGARILGYSVDLSDRDATDAAFAELEAEGLFPDLLINSAGVINSGEFTAMTPDFFSDNFDHGFWTVVNPCRAVARTMVDRGHGYIANVSSVAGFLGVYGYTGYASAKFATMGFTESLRCEMVADGVGVSVICPPDTDTPAYTREKSMRTHETEVIAGTIKAVAPDVIADAVVKGVAHGRYLVIPGFSSKLFFRLKGLVPELAFAIVDAQVRGARREMGKGAERA